jgi:hypothetical protein
LDFSVLITGRKVGDKDFTVDANSRFISSSLQKQLIEAKVCRLREYMASL